MNPKVSIITPTYNSATYIDETIQSVRNQSYQNWEMVVTDDCSSDDTQSIVSEWCNRDERIKLFILDKNSGAATARNTSLYHSSGRFIAYLDADDLWYPDKLEKQIHFMRQQRCGFSCTSYEVIDEKGNPKNKVVVMKDVLDYKGFLINNLLQTVGIMADTEIVNRKCLEMPQMRRRQDAATWLLVLKDGNACYGMQEVLAKYRRVSGSLSSNKVKAVKGIWYLYRKVEKLPLYFACYCFIRYAIFAVIKRVYLKDWLKK